MFVFPQEGDEIKKAYEILFELVIKTGANRSSSFDDINFTTVADKKTGKKLFGKKMISALNIVGHKEIEIDIKVGYWMFEKRMRILISAS
ncbi:MAG TPA: hypothetical protein PLM93_10145 [Sulfuricurvum sp.]|nr:MAG: hypothetical protein B7Y30_11360 [Campylobacterales bacterium 16-40-21]OZA02064.1 MAG: hypothetical protein B7X89_10860 [Sulfuricurvum sp. 17-40-25]HQS67529.1 hypothetical protein [Sulfuricurvum sp.]HQS84838.1 hypothetical protein [Alphaproteobacteria bacterium]